MNRRFIEFSCVEVLVRDLRGASETCGFVAGMRRTSAKAGRTRKVAVYTHIGARARPGRRPSLSDKPQCLTPAGSVRQLYR